MTGKNIFLPLLFILSLFLVGCGGGGAPAAAPAAPAALGSITINITGVPPGIDADVLLIAVNEIQTDGRSRKWTITHSQTAKNLKPQLYYVSALTFDAGFTKYEIGFPGDKNFMPTPDIVSVDLAAGQAVTVDLDYVPRAIIPGAIDIQVDDSVLPAGTTFKPMTLIGPLDSTAVSRTAIKVSTSTAVGGLFPGAYFLRNPDFSLQGKDYATEFRSLFGFVREGEVENTTLKVVQVPVWRKSVSDIPVVAVVGARDPTGNFFTVETIPTATMTNPTARHVAHKWDAQGKLLWSSIIAQQTYQYWSWTWAADSSGNFYAVGYEDTGVFIGLQLQNLPAQLYKFSPSGYLLWMVEIPGLTGGDLARVEHIAVVDNKVITLSTRAPIAGNVRLPRQAQINVLNAHDGSAVNRLSDSSIGAFGRVQIDATATGIWALASDRIIHYSANGDVLGSLFIGVPDSYADNGGVTYHFDNAGGLFVATTVAGAQDSDVQVSHYLPDFSLDWQHEVPNPGEDSIDATALGYDPVGGRILIEFYADGKIAGYGGLGHDVLMEWNVDGTQNWIRQMGGFGSGTTRIEPVAGTLDWQIDVGFIGFATDFADRVVLGP